MGNKIKKTQNAVPAAPSSSPLHKHRPVNILCMRLQHRVRVNKQQGARKSHKPLHNSARSNRNGNIRQRRSRKTARKPQTDFTINFVSFALIAQQHRCYKKKHKTRVRVLTCIIRNIVRSKIVVVNKHRIAQLVNKEFIYKQRNLKICRKRRYLSFAKNILRNCNNNSKINVYLLLPLQNARFMLYMRNIYILLIYAPHNIRIRMIACLIIKFCYIKLLASSTEISNGFR